MLVGETLSNFLSQDWRLRARVFREAIDVSQYPIDAVSIARLTENEAVESRLIQPDFTFEFGPFELTSDDQARLLGDQEMLMVQCLEQHLGIIDDLLTREFSFLPRWQIDDVMASIGYDGANCGAHFDHYDVFLLQVSGSKVWHLDREIHTDNQLLSDQDLRLLDNFEPVEKLLLEPGDVLYIPPGAGHHGICEGESLTLSVGIRNPTTTEMLAEISEFALENTKLDTLETSLHKGSAEISAGIPAALKTNLDQLLDEAMLQRWYGSYVTRLRNPEVLSPVDSGDTSPPKVKANLPTRMAWMDTADSILFFVNGECYERSAEERNWIVTLCESRKLELTKPDEPFQALLSELNAAGALSPV